MKNKLFELFNSNEKEFTTLMQEFDRLFCYDENTGIVTRKIGVRGQAKGKIVGSDNGKGYLRVTINREPYLLHILIFAKIYGYVPEVVEHKDLLKHNNAKENLRPANKSLNERNTGLRENNTSGIKNVPFIKEKGKYRVQLRFNGKINYFGYYEDLELAELVANAAREKYHGEFCRHA